MDKIIDRRDAALGGSLSLRGDYSFETLSKLGDPGTWDLVQVDADPSVWRVKSRRTGEYRRVQIISDSWIICSCENGRHAGGNARCYHAAMVELWVGEEGA